MKEDTKDIYASPEGDAGDGGAPIPPTDPTPPQFRRVRRNILLFLLLMTAILAVATWLIYLQERRGVRDDLATDVLAEQRIPAARRRLLQGNASLPRIFAPAPPRSGSETGTVVKIDPQKMGRAMGEMRLAQQYLRVRDWDRAEQHARQALAIWPDMNAALRMIGVIYTQRGQFTEAIEILERALKADPFNAEIYNNLATAYMHGGDMQRAEDLLLAALQIHPTYTAARLNLGLLYLAADDYASAAEALEEVIDQAPEQSSIRNNYAVALLRLGRYEEARRQLGLVIKRDPGLVAAYFNMAITYVLEGDAEKAMNWIHKGAEYCSPVTLEKFLADSDFDAIRDNPDFKALIRKEFPKTPLPPRS